MNKIIVRIKGGLGNQLFCYAAARRLALANNVELVIDHVTGFVRDRKYQRQYMLDRFSIPVRRATYAERLEPLERYRRALLKWQSRNRPFHQRRYIEQEGRDFDERLLHLKIRGFVYLDGYWQSESYFKDIEQIIREDLRIRPPGDLLNTRMAQSIRNCNAVAIHVRWFDPPSDTGTHNLIADYYHRAISYIQTNTSAPHYFLFSDDPKSAAAKLHLSSESLTCVSHNDGTENAYADLWLMSLCRHFIIANSTFSWWGAWLGSDREKIVIAPDVNIQGITAWGFKGLIPSQWVRL